jgi:3-hydroxyisobutyrate dehydrogenase-like beta-hydroxyacid dehydrogenase
VTRTAGEVPSAASSAGRARIALLGLGEAGSAIAADLVAAGADVRGYDPLVSAPPGCAQRHNEQDAVRDAELVLSVNSSHDAASALNAALGTLRPDSIWADLNTASPGLKQQLATTVADRGVLLVDVALLAPMPGRGLRTPMMMSGPGAQRGAETLRGWGASVEVIDGPPGAASSRKLLRSVFYKGLAAAVVEALDGASAAGLEDWLRDNIAGELAGFDRQTIDRLVEGTHAHARRRADEMAAAAEQLRELGVQPRIALAAHDLLTELRDRADVPTEAGSVRPE